MTTILLYVMVLITPFFAGRVSSEDTTTSGFNWQEFLSPEATNAGEPNLDGPWAETLGSAEEMQQSYKAGKGFTSWLQDASPDLPYQSYLPPFLRTLMTDLIKLADYQPNLQTELSTELSKVQDVINMAKTWAESLELKLGLNLTTTIQARTSVTSPMPSPSPFPPPLPKTTRQLAFKAVLTPTLDVVSNIVAVRPSLQRIYFNYWNATFQRYAGYAEQAKQQRGLSSSVPIIDQLVARFRQITGTTCVPAAFTPPQQQNASITGRAVTLILNKGNCQLSRIASQTRKDFNLRCVLPRASLAITQPRYTSQYVSSANFRGAVCRRQYTYGAASTATIELWNPGAFTDKTSNFSRLLPLSDADDNGIPNIIDKIGKYKLVRQTLRSFRADFVRTINDATTPLEALKNRLIDKLKGSGLDVQIGGAVGAVFQDGQARRATRRAAIQDLSTLFPKLTEWELGTGVTKIYDEVLQSGLMATLYRGPGKRKGLFSLFRSMGQSAGDDSDDSYDDYSVEDAEQGQETQGDISTTDIFKQIADEMDRLMEAKAVEMEAGQRTGRKVIKTKPVNIDASSSSSPSTITPTITTMPTANTTANGMASATNTNSTKAPFGSTAGDDAGAGYGQESASHEVSAANIAAAARHLVQAAGWGFAAASQWSSVDYHDDDGGVEVSPTV